MMNQVCSVFTKYIKRCNKKCGCVCQDCKEKCRNACIHTACTKRCGELCDREGCDEPCTELLKCGHKCIGLCGEECPTQCRICDGEYFDALSRITLAEADEDSRFVQLSDCGHTFDVEYMDGSLRSTYEENSTSKAVTVPCCPVCRIHILRAPSRYANIVKRSQAKANEIKKKMDRGVWLRLQVNTSLKDLDRQPSKRQGKLAHQLTMLVDMLQKEESVSLHTLIAQILRLMKTEDAVAAINTLNALKKNRVKVGTVQGELLLALNMLGIEDASPLRQTQRGAMVDWNTSEIRTEAFHVFVQLAFFFATQEGMTEAAKSRIEVAKQLAKMPGVNVGQHEVKMLDVALTDVHAAEKAYGDATRREMGQKGSWHTCPNGHFYLIGDCGGAREASKCPDCRSTVGGSAYTLAAGNAAVGDTPWAAQVQMQHLPPAPDVLARIAADEAAGIREE